MHNDLTGVWFGEYQKPNGASPVNFMLNIDDCGLHFDGRMDEPNTFAELGSARLVAHVEGARSGKNIFFTKACDGTGNVKRLVSYTGRLTPGGNRIEGHWAVDGRTGPFAMARPIIANDYIDAEFSANTGG